MIVEMMKQTPRRREFSLSVEMSLKRLARKERLEDRYQSRCVVRFGRCRLTNARVMRVGWFNRPAWIVAVERTDHFEGRDGKKKAQTKPASAM
jgi:hypothetical protein